MKSDVIYYELKPFHTEYGYLESEYYYIQMSSRGTQNHMYSKSKQMLISITLN